VARQLGAFLPHPGFQLVHQRRAQFLAHGSALSGVLAVDLAFDVEQGVNAMDRLQSDRRDDRRLALRFAPGASGLALTNTSHGLAGVRVCADEDGH
jgi:hypothetical protein